LKPRAAVKRQVPPAAAIERGAGGEKFPVQTSRMKPDTNPSEVPKIAYLSLGSNVGNREAQLRAAQVRLSAITRVVALSSFYETEPVEYVQQPWFLNCAVAIETNETPEQLISALLRIEQEMGRQRAQKNGPRSIDIDILLLADRIMESKDLTIPHPAMHLRRFVLEPLAEIAPEALHPVFKKTIRELLDELPTGQAVRRIPPSANV
jgi:2-amino-4-hydroxy-6-hydroxymethyldihydropteridine diphosphokinase